MAILTNYDRCNNNNQPKISNMIQIRSDYDKKTECQTNIIERRNGLWKLHLLGSVSSRSHHTFLKRVKALTLRKLNSEYQRANNLFKSRWLCNTKACSQIFTSNTIRSQECLNFNLFLRTVARYEFN